MYVTRKQLDKAIREFTMDSDEVDVRTDYSGRGMYGRTCVGVVGSSVSVALRFMFALAEQISEDGDDAWEQRENVMELAEDLRTDSMAYDTIYYFPGLVIEEN